jgi:hypothetical protein
VWFLPSSYKQNNSRIYLIVRQSQACKDVNTEIEGTTALEAVNQTTTGEDVAD